GITTFISRRLNKAHSKGILCVTSAGNSGNSSWWYVSTPAGAEASPSVGPVTSEGQCAWSSWVRPTADQRIKPDVTAQGAATVFSNQNGNITAGNGTSFSAPIISGLAACLWSAYPELTNVQLKHLIKQSAHLHQNPNNYLGYGIPNFYQ